MRLTRHLRYSNVASTLALFVALGGGVSYAATTPAPNSVGSAQLKRNAVTSAKLHGRAVTSAKLARGAVDSAAVRDGTLRAADFAPGQLTTGAQGEKGEKGEKGDTGIAGAKGDAGPAGPAGSVAMLARMNGIPHTGTQQVTFGSPAGSSTAATAEDGVSMVSPDVALTASDLVVDITNAVLNNSARRFTLRVAGADTPLSCTIGRFNTTCNSAEKVTVPPRTLISIKSDRPANFNSDPTDARIAFQLTR
jgi:hypothetical protein